MPILLENSKSAWTRETISQRNKNRKREGGRKQSEKIKGNTRYISHHLTEINSLELLSGLTDSQLSVY